MMKKKLALFLGCCLVGGFAASCNDTDEWDPNGVKCEEGAKVCDANAVKVCSGGQFVVQTQCTSVQKCDAATLSCVDNLPSCTEGAFQCAGSNVQVCQGGNWVLSKTCEAGTTCNSSTGMCDGAVASECEVGATKCEGNALVTCGSDGHWGAGNACGENQECAAGEDGKMACIDLPIVGCEPGATRCDGDKLATCTEEAIWGESVSCEADDVCIVSDGVAACGAPVGCEDAEHGDTRCAEDSVEVCQNGTWVTSSDCTGDTPVCLDGACVECVAGDSKCEDAAIFACGADGLWDAGTDCDAPANGVAACVANACGFTCDDGYVVNTAGDGCVEKPAESDCGNGVLDDGEACDGTLFPAGETCTSAMNDGKTYEGSLSCSDACEVVTTACSEVVTGVDYTTVKEIRADYDVLVDTATCPNSGTHDTSVRKTVDITGAVTAIRSNSMGFILQEASADGKNSGILVYCKDKACVEGLSVGDNVRVEANGVGQYYCQLQVRADIAEGGTLKVTKLDSNAIVIEPTVVSVADASDADLKNPYNNVLVKVEGIESGDWSKNNPKGYTGTSGSVSVVVSNYLYSSVQGAMQAGKTYDVTGIVVYTFSTSTVNPRVATDIVEKTVSETCTVDVCQDGMIQKCTDGALQEAVSCTNVANADGVCKSTTECDTAFTCKSGYELKDGACVKTGSEIPVGTEFIEKFDGFTKLTQSYATGTQTIEYPYGVKVDWSYSNARNADGTGIVPIDGAALVFHQSGTRELVGTLPTGVGEISLEVQSAFTNTKARNVRIFINDAAEPCGQVGWKDLEVKHDIKCTVNLSGDVKVKVESIGSQALIDNLRWTSN